MNDFVKHYLIAALWSSSDGNGDNLDKNYGVEDISEESIKKAIKDCEYFQAKAGDLLDSIDDEHGGHNFFLTRNGHGEGFWSRGYEGDIGEKLTELCKEFGSVDFYKGDDGCIHC